MTNTTIKAKTVDLGELELGDKVYALVELEVMDEGRKRNGKTGTVDYRGVVIKEVLRLEGNVPGELASELRRQAREREEGETGIAVVPGLEGFLDSAGVVVTEADREEPDLKGVETALDLGARELGIPTDGEAAWLALGVEVHGLRITVDAGGTDAGDARARLDALFSDLNELNAGDEVLDDDGELIVIDTEGEIRPAIALPDFELELVDPAEEAFNAGQDGSAVPEPWAGYAELTVPQVLEHLESYLEADKALGGPTPQAFDYVTAALVFERANGARAGLIKPLDRIVAELALALPPPAEELVEDFNDFEGPPWETYDKDTADTIVGHLKAKAEREGDDATRPLVAAVEAYETAGKARKGVLGRLGGIVAPPLPAGPDIGGDDELVDALDKLEDDAVDSELEEV